MAPHGLPARCRTRIAVLRSRGRLSVGRDVRLGRGVEITVARGARIRFGDGVALGAGTRLDVRGGTLEVGDHVWMGDGCVFELGTDATIEADVQLGDEVVVLDHRPQFDEVDRPVRTQDPKLLPIAIRRGARLGPRAVVTAGVSIGPRARIGAHAVVEQDVPADGSYSGPPQPAAVSRPTPPRRRDGPGAF